MAYVFIFVATSMLYRTQLCKAFWCNFLTTASKPPKCQYDTATFGLAFVIKASYTRPCTYSEYATDMWAV